MYTVGYWVNRYFDICVPGIMFITGYQYSLSFFKGWTVLAFVWLMVAGIFITIRPLMELFKKDQ
ncbi:hypothetical protein ABE402_08190 [Bacillus smithii]|uniref:hypothetical protein n=1 Tax=Bacillus smithii TaxID=1479 RepID=UPI003D202BAA